MVKSKAKKTTRPTKSTKTIRKTQTKGAKVAGYAKAKAVKATKATKSAQTIKAVKRTGSSSKSVIAGVASKLRQTCSTVGKFVAANSIAATFLAAAVLTILGTGLAVVLRSRSAESQLAEVTVPATGDEAAAIQTSNFIGVESGNVNKETAEDAADEAGAGQTEPGNESASTNGVTNYAGTAGSSASVTRISARTETTSTLDGAAYQVVVTELVRFNGTTPELVEDASLPSGTRITERESSDGLREINYLVIYDSNDRELSRTKTSESVIRAAQAARIRVGTAPVVQERRLDTNPVTIGGEEPEHANSSTEPSSADETDSAADEPSAED